MFFIGHFFKRISSDFRQKELLPLKLLFFVHSSTLYVLYPYLTIHMRELGINVEETAIMSAVTPVVAIIMPPIAGVIADRIGNFKVILSLFSGLGGAVSLFLLLVPVGRVVITYPQKTILQTACSNGSVFMSVADHYPCQRVYNKSLEIPVQMEACGLACFPPPSLQESFARKDGREGEIELLKARNYSVVITDEGQNTTDTYSYWLEGGEPQLHWFPEDQSNSQVARQSRTLENPAHFATTVRKLADGAYFFPTSGLYKFECVSGRCGPRRREGQHGPPPHRPLYRMTLHQPSRSNSLHVVSLVRNSTSETPGHHRSWNSTCPVQFGAEEEKVIVPVTRRKEVGEGGEEEEYEETEEELILEECSVRCLATVRRTQVCTNRNKLYEYDIRLTFWFYLSIRVFIGMISGTAFAMFEGAVIAILREHKADYGLQRIYATIGGMISSPVSGWLIDYASDVNGFADFRPAFYLYAGLKIVSALLMLTINLEFKVPATNVLSDVVTVLKKIEIVALFITCFILGTAWGYIESFLFWLLQDLGASRSLMGITITVGGIAGLPLLVMSGPIIDRIGHANVLFIGFIFYGIRLIGYSLIYNPWMCLIFEAMESVTSSLAFTAAVTYAAKLSTTTTDSSIQGLLGGLYFGVGKGSGSLIGGYLMKAVGTRPTYQIFAAMMLVTGCLYYLFNKFYIVHHRDTSPDKMKPEKIDKEKKEVPEAKKSAEVNHLTIESIPMKNCIKASDKSNNDSSEQSTNLDSKIESQIANNHISHCNTNEGFVMEDETSNVSLEEKNVQHENR